MNVNTSSPKVYPRIINHVAISVPNLNEAVKLHYKRKHIMMMTSDYWPSQTVKYPR
jgi:hypothetical protein